MNKIARLGLVALMLGFGATSWAGTPVVHTRHYLQEQRIDQGVASGELNQREAARLDARQEHIANVEARAKADGVVTRKERARLHQKQERANAAIALQKHDTQRHH